MRKSKVVVIQDQGRDHGKHYLITEMSAAKAERWASRAFLALARSGIDLPEDVQSAGMAAMAVVGFQALARIQFDEAQVLMDEMMACVQYMPSPERPEIVRQLMDEADDIEEVYTRFYLKAEVFDLHTGFSTAAALSSSAVAAPARTDDDTPRPSTSLRRSRRR